MLDIFENKNNTIAFILIIIAAVIYSSVGLFAAIAQSAGIPFLLLIVVSGVFALIINGFFLLIRKVSFKKSISLIFSDTRIRGFFYCRLLLSSHTFLMMGGFYLLSNKGLGVIVYEMHPIISIIFSYFLLADVYKKESNFIMSWGLIIIAALGVSIISYEEITVSIDGSLFIQVMGMLLILLATIFRGLIAPIAPKMSILLIENNLNQNKFNNALVVQFMTLLCLVPILILTMGLLYGVELGSMELMELPAKGNGLLLSIGLVLGAIIFSAAILHNISGTIAMTHNIYLGYFIAPVSGITLLYWFGYAQINFNITLALVLIIVPNILLNVKQTGSIREGK